MIQIRPSLFEGARMTMREAIDLSLASLAYYGAKYKHWCIAYSGGKDSSATVSFVVWAIRNKLVPAPEKLYVLYADTRQELDPLWTTADRFLAELRTQGIDARRVLPTLDNRFYVYMLGRGVPPPSNTFRWCTERLKIKPMEDELERVAQETTTIVQAQSTGMILLPPKFLQITGVRQGESANRDARIAVSCSTKDGECGQGWFQSRPSTHVADTLAPLVHWRQCFVWDWLYFANVNSYVSKILEFPDATGHGYDYLADIAVAYGSDDARTGCVGCNLASRDVALENITKTPEWAHLAPLLELKPLFAVLKKAKNRLRKAAPETRKDGQLAANGQRLGPITLEARLWGLERVLDIQQRARVNLIDAEEEARIRELIALETWPQGWDGGLTNPNHVIGDEALDRITVADHHMITQPRLL
jgi:DNA sulfur modification protein DndC